MSNKTRRNQDSPLAHREVLNRCATATDTVKDNPKEEHEPWSPRYTVNMNSLVIIIVYISLIKE